MTMYSYRDEESGAYIEQVFAMGEAPETVEFDGITMKRDRQSEWAGRRPDTRADYSSIAIGCNPVQALEYTKNAHRHGCNGTHFDPDTGRAMWGSGSAGRAERKKYCRTFGYTDQDAGYSDPVPN